MVVFLHAVQCILVAYYYTSGLCLIISYHYLAPPFFPLPTDNHEFVLNICESVSVLKYICFLLHFKSFDMTKLLWWFSK